MILSSGPNLLLSCCVTLNKFPKLSGPQCPCESNEGLGLGELRTQAASLCPWAGSGEGKCVAWIVEDSTGFVDRPFPSL